MSNKSTHQDALDPEMLKNLDFLLELETLQGESQWDLAEAVETTETEEPPPELDSEKESP